MSRAFPKNKTESAESRVVQEFDADGNPIVSSGATRHGYVPDATQRIPFPDPVRMRPGMYIGDVGTCGLHHLLKEIVDNAVDEAMAGHATRIDISLGTDYSLSVRDNGRGIPARLVGNSEKSAVEYVFTELHGGHHDLHSNVTPRVSGGLHGVGAASVNALSEWLVCETRHGGAVHRMRFERGVAVSPLEAVGVCDPGDTGTTVTWLADKTMFKPALTDAGNPAYSPTLIADRLRELSYLLPLVRFTFHDRLHDAPPKTFHAPNGVADFVRLLNRDRAGLFPTDPIALSGMVGMVRVEAAVQWTNDTTDPVMCGFANLHPTADGGAQLCRVSTRPDASGQRRGGNATYRQECSPGADRGCRRVSTVPRVVRLQ